MGAEVRLLPRCWSRQAKCPRLLIWSRAAIQANGMVVCERNCQASSTFLGLALASRFKVGLTPADPFELLKTRRPASLSFGIPHSPNNAYV